MNIDYLEYFKIPYKNPYNQSLNCYELVKYFYQKNMDIDLPNYGEFSEDKSQTDKIIKENSKSWIKLEKPEPYCVVVFYSPFPYVAHMGIVLEDCKRFLHTIQKKNTCIETLNHRYWVNQIAGYYKWI